MATEPQRFHSQIYSGNDHMSGFCKAKAFVVWLENILILFLFHSLACDRNLANQLEKFIWG